MRYMHRHVDGDRISVDGRHIDRADRAVIAAALGRIARELDDLDVARERADVS